MKVGGAKAARFIERPPDGIKAILLFGPDAGLVRERGSALVGRFAAADDPFAVSEMTADSVRKDPAALADGARSLSLMGGEPVVRIREAGDGIAATVEAWLDAGGGAQPGIFEAGELAPRSKLRKLFESRDDAAAIGCYPDSGADLEALVREHFRARGIAIDPTAVAPLLAGLGGDRLAVRQELDKLVLYAGGPDSGGVLTAADIESALGDFREASLDDIAIAVGGGSIGQLGSAIDRAVSEGASPIAILRAVQRHFERMHAVRCEADAGGSIDAAVRKLRPPVFFKLVAAFSGQVRAWTAGDLTRGLDLLLDAERTCKSGIGIDQAVCARALLQLAQAGRRRTR